MDRAKRSWFRYALGGVFAGAVLVAGVGLVRGQYPPPPVIEIPVAPASSAAPPLEYLPPVPAAPPVLPVPTPPASSIAPIPPVPPEFQPAPLPAAPAQPLPAPAVLPPAAPAAPVAPSGPLAPLAPTLTAAPVAPAAPLAPAQPLGPPRSLPAAPAPFPVAPVPARTAAPEYPAFQPTQPTVPAPPGSLPPSPPPPAGAPMPLGPGDVPTRFEPAPSTTPAPDPAKSKFDISWQNGVFFQTADKNFSFHAGGTIHYDAAWYQATPILELGPGGTGKFHDGVNMRRARLFMEGTAYQAVDYKLELEFMNGIGFSVPGPSAPTQTVSVTNSPGPTDAWITIKDVPGIGNVRIGSQKEWFSLEHLNSYRYLEFMERSYLFDFAQPTAFNNGFTPGISLFRTWLDDRAFSAVGAYKNESDLIGFGLGDGQYAVTGRLAYLPIWMPDDQIFWHVGGAMSHRDPVDDAVQIRIRDNVRNAPFPLLNLVANTGPIPTRSQDLYNLETAAVWGPITLQAEYTANVLNGAAPAAGLPGRNLFFQGCYVEALWLLTGESRTWNTKNFFFNRVVPHRPLRLKRDGCECRGFGAWEVGVRYSYVDLSNRFVQAGRLDAVTLGLNWYLNANAKLQFNYDATHRGDFPTPAQGTIHAFGTRMAVDF